MDYPVLLAVLLRMLGEGGKPAVKRDLLRLLGILGALDPHRHKARQTDKMIFHKPSYNFFTTLCFRLVSLPSFF